MARLTYQDADGSWGLHGVSWSDCGTWRPAWRRRPGRPKQRWRKEAGCHGFSRDLFV